MSLHCLTMSRRISCDVLVHQRNDMLRLADQRAIDPHQRFGMLRKTGNMNVFLFLKPFQHRLNRIDGDVGKILLNISGGQIFIMSPEYLHDIGFSFGEMGFCHDHHSLRFYFKRTKQQMQSVLTAISPDQTIKKSKRDHDKSACSFSLDHPMMNNIQPDLNDII